MGRKLWPCWLPCVRRPHSEVHKATVGRTCVRRSDVGAGRRLRCLVGTRISIATGGKKKGKEKDAEHAFPISKVRTNTIPYRLPLQFIPRFPRILFQSSPLSVPDSPETAAPSSTP